MVTLRDHLPPTALRALERVVEGPAAPPEADPKVIVDRAEKIATWARGFLCSVRQDSLHLTQAMLDGIPDAELRAEVVLAVLVQQATDQQITIVPRPGNPFMASSMAEALRRIVELGEEDLQGQAPGRGLEGFEQLLTATLEGLGTPNPPGYVPGEQVELSPEPPLSFRGKGGMGLRFGASSPRLDLEPRGDRWVYTSVADARRPGTDLSLEGLHDETLGELQQRIRSILGAAAVRPTHPGLARFADAAAGPYATLQHCLEAIEQALAARAVRARGYERLQTQQLLGLLGVDGGVAKVDRQALEAVVRAN